MSHTVKAAELHSGDRVKATVGMSILVGEIKYASTSNLGSPYAGINPDGLVNVWPIDDTWTIELIERPQS